ncbi:hypothetical protein H4Q26_000774 [Puccinia striiformis f. sp. tritici PST-130]|uniref:Uncharacterized protein n=1 Tax=Puccinia striiformis f. sp. tritici PST-78 TaxID=1165861 RepID=A0A0L0VFY1_9BASI|nr:hypothetical protein H4Q26_000774 [Puccinia striiformis f. sp. tritici PST-130]KNE98163.1 hypothetical protein PSTG_08627 [Puccinia striiformis f. sp. tritici PST-78]
MAPPRFDRTPPPPLSIQGIAPVPTCEGCATQHHSQKCWNCVPSLNPLKRNKDNDLVGPSAILLDHQPPSIIVDSQQVSSHQQEQAISQSSKQLESSLLPRITLPTKENRHNIA